MKIKTITGALLEHLSENKHLIIDALLPHKYPEARLARTLLGLDNFYSRYPSRKVAKHSLSSILSSLKRQGLVACTGTKQGAEWTITTKGRRHATHTRTKTGIMSDFPPIDGIIRIITFDIPEKERSKRNWLRTLLLNCGYRTLQKSVYIGMRPLPDTCIREIDHLGISKYIHIAAIHKKGTLEKAFKV